VLYRCTTENVQWPAYELSHRVLAWHFEVHTVKRKLLEHQLAHKYEKYILHMTVSQTSSKKAIPELHAAMNITYSNIPPTVTYHLQ